MILFTLNFNGALERVEIGEIFMTSVTLLSLNSGKNIVDSGIYSIVWGKYNFFKHVETLFDGFDIITYTSKTNEFPFHRMK